MIALMVAACTTAPKSESGKSELEAKADATVMRFKTTDPMMAKTFFASAKAYAVFPTVGKGGVGIGGAYGKGVLYEGGRAVGYCDLSQASIGFQLGGQAYSEVIFFQDELGLANFKSGSLEFAAQASAVAAAADASANADYDHGVAVFTLAGKGLMYEASIGGQKFSYQAK
jgi:lipid-binding SYLF domain-containing protein